MAKRIGLLGCGVVADYGHSWAIAQTDGLELAGRSLKSLPLLFGWRKHFERLDSVFSLFGDKRADLFAGKIAGEDECVP